MEKRERRKLVMGEMEAALVMVMKKDRERRDAEALLENPKPWSPDMPFELDLGRVLRLLRRLRRAQASERGAAR